MVNRDPITTLMTQSEICKTIGERVRSRRKQLKLSRKALSLKSAVSVPTISRLELKGVTTLGVLVKIAQALGAVDSFDSLFSVSKYGSMREFLEKET